MAEAKKLQVKMRTPIKIFRAAVFGSADWGEPPGAKMLYPRRGNVGSTRQVTEGMLVPCALASAFAAAKLGAVDTHDLRHNGCVSSCSFILPYSAGRRGGMFARRARESLA